MSTPNVIRPRTCSERCGAACFTCAQGVGEYAAQCGRSLSPKSLTGAKRCGVCAGITMLFAIAIIVQAILVPPLLHRELVKGLHKAVVLDDPASEQFAKWEDNRETPLVLSTYVYHIENPLEILAGEKPRLKEMGPYVYKQRTINFNWTFGDEETGEQGMDVRRRVLHFRSFNTYEFDRAASVGDEHTNVTTINMPFISIRAAYEVDPGVAVFSLFKFMGKYAEGGEDVRLFANVTVREVLLGWHDPVVAIMPPMGKRKWRGYLNGYDSIEDFLGDTQCEGKHCAAHFWNSIYTGRDDTFKRNREFLRWHNQSFVATCKHPDATDLCVPSKQVPAWFNHSGAAALRGNDGSVFQLPVNERSKPAIFFPPFMRSIDLEFKKTHSYKDVPLMQFGLPSTFWLNSTEHPPNERFWQNGPTGLLNMSTVQGNIPLYVSQPRFFETDPSLAALVNASYLAPADAKHTPQTMFEVEPESGVTFHVATASQVNLFVSPLPVPHDPDSEEPPEDPWFQHMQSMYFPVMWAAADGGIADSDATIITEVLGVIHLSQTGGFIIGISLAVLGVLYLFLSWRAYDLESSRHLAAVRSLITSEGDGAAAGANLGAAGGAPPSASMLDSSMLIMQDDKDKPNNGYGAQRRMSDADEIDISYREQSTSAQPNTKGAYQQM